MRVHHMMHVHHMMRVHHIMCVHHMMHVHHMMCVHHKMDDIDYIRDVTVDANSRIDITDIASLAQCAVSTAKSRAKSCGSGPFLFVTSESPKLLSNQFFHQILLTKVKYLSSNQSPNQP